MAATGTPTPNIGLRIPLGTDPASVDDINYNFNLIDTKLGAVGNDSVQDQIDDLNSNLTATNDRTLTKRYYSAVTINTTNTSWSWSTGYIQLVGDLIIYSSGISPKTATNDWLRVATVESSYKPAYEVRTVCVAEDGTASRVIRIDTNGNIEIYKPEVKAYWFTLIWLRNISN